MTATSTSQNLLGIARKLNGNYVTQIMIQHFALCLNHMKYQELLMEDEDDICELGENHGRDSDTDFVSISTKERENFNQPEHNDLIKEWVCQRNYQNFQLLDFKR